MRATVAFPHGVCCRPCRAYARAARIVICIAYGHVVFTVTERYCAGGGSDPREGRSPSRADPELSLLPRLGRKGHINGARFPNTADVRTKLCGVQSTTWLQSFCSFPCARLSRPKISPTSPYLPFPPALLSTVLQVDQNCAPKQKPTNRLSASKSWFRNIPQAASSIICH